MAIDIAKLEVFRIIFLLIDEAAVVIRGIGLNRLPTTRPQRRANQTLIFADQLAVALYFGSEEGRELWFVLPLGHGSLTVGFFVVDASVYPGIARVYATDLCTDQ
jgi:hypothetical protein